MKMRHWTGRPPREPGYWWRRCDDVWVLLRLTEDGGWRYTTGSVKVVVDRDSEWCGPVCPPGD